MFGTKKCICSCNLAAKSKASLFSYMSGLHRTVTFAVTPEAAVDGKILRPSNRINSQYVCKNEDTWEGLRRKSRANHRIIGVPC